MGRIFPSGFDCSGICILCNQSLWKRMESGKADRRGIAKQLYVCFSGRCKAGGFDLFQGTYSTPGASHVGIYVGNNMMIHCGDRSIIPISVQHTGSNILCVLADCHKKRRVKDLNKNHQEIYGGDPRQNRRSLIFSSISKDFMLL